MNNIDSFSEREQEVIELLVQGKSNKQIALQLKISNRTVEFHLSNIYSKLGVSSRTEAVLLFMKDASAELVEEPVETTWRESTDAPKDELSYNGEKRKQRDFMKKRTYYLIGSGLLIAVLLALAFVIAPDHDLKNLLAGISGEYSDIVPVAVATPQEDGAIIHTVEEGQTLWSIAAAYGITVEQLRQMNGSPVESDIIYVGQKLYIQPSPSLDPEVTSTVSFYVQTSEDENTYIKELDSSTLTLIVKWFYIDETRLYLDLLVSGYPLPEDFSPVQIIDLQNIIIHRADGSLIDLENAEQYGSVGGAGGNDSQEEELRFFEGIIDVGLPSSIEENSQKETYTIEIPIGGEVYAEDGEVRTLPVESFSIDVKPSYVGQLTFSTVKTAVIDDKTVIFRGIEINPSQAAVLFCVFDPQGNQWLPSIHLLYKGNEFSEAGLFLTDGDPSSQMCYRIYYDKPFRFDPEDDPQSTMSVWVGKLTEDQPEKLSDELVTDVQNDLSKLGIEFNYVIVDHGGGIEVTAKPAGMTKEEAQIIIWDALIAESIPEGNLIFYLP